MHPSAPVFFFTCRMQDNFTCQWESFGAQLVNIKLIRKYIFCGIASNIGVCYCILLNNSVKQ